MLNNVKRKIKWINDLHFRRQSIISSANDMKQPFDVETFHEWAWPGVAWQGVAWSVVACPGVARRGVVGRGLRLARRCEVGHGVAWPGVGAAWPGLARCGVVSRGVPWCDKAWRGRSWCGLELPWPGVVRRGVVGRGVVRRGVAWSWSGLIWQGVCGKKRLWCRNPC